MMFGYSSKVIGTKSEKERDRSEINSQNNNVSGPFLGISRLRNATQLIQTGDEITVDGYLGIVTLGDTGLGGSGGHGLKENSVMDFEGT